MVHLLFVVVAASCQNKMTIEIRNSIDQPMANDSLQQGDFYRKCYFNNGVLKKVELITSSKRLLGVEYYKSDESNEDIIALYKDSLLSKSLSFFSFNLKIITEQKKFNYKIRNEESFSKGLECGENTPCKTERFIISNDNVLWAYAIKESKWTTEQITKYKYHPDGTIALETTQTKEGINYIVRNQNNIMVNYEAMAMKKAFDKNEYFPFEDLSYYVSLDFEPNKALPERKYRPLHADTTVKYLNEIGFKTDYQYLNLRKKYSKLNYTNNLLRSIEYYDNNTLASIDYYIENTNDEATILSKKNTANFNIIFTEKINDSIFYKNQKQYRDNEFQGYQKILLNKWGQALCIAHFDNNNNQLQFRTVKTYYNGNGHIAFTCSYSFKGELKQVLLKQSIIPNLEPYRYEGINGLTTFKNTYFTNTDISYYFNSEFDLVKK